MPRFVHLVSFTEQGIQTVKDLPERFADARKAIEDAGGKLLSWNLTMGPYDIVVVTEFPDAKTAATVALTIAGFNDIRTTTMRAFSEAEAKEIVEKVP